MAVKPVAGGAGGRTLPRVERRPRPIIGKRPPKPAPKPSPAPTPSKYYTPTPSQTVVRKSAQERAAERRERRQERRDRIESIRGRHAELRLRRLRARLVSVDDSLLGTPLGIQEGLPTLIGERWNRMTNQSIPDSTWTTIQYGNSSFTADAAGYSSIYDSSTNVWRIPHGLAGVWRFNGNAAFDSNSTGGRQVRVLLNGSTTIYQFRLPAGGSGIVSLPIAFTYEMSDTDYFVVQVQQNSGASLDLVGGREYVSLSVTFEGLVG